MFHKKLNPFLAILIITIITGGAASILLQEIDRAENQRSLPLLIHQPISNQTIDATESSDWKTYRNEEYGFEVKIPADWVVTNTDDGIRKAITFESRDTDELVASRQIDSGYRSNLRFEFWSSISDAPEVKGNGFDLKNVEEFFSGRFLVNVTKIGVTTISNRTAYEYIEGGKGSAYGVLIENNGHFYNLVFERTWSKAELPEIEAMVLSSFQIH